MRVPELGAGVVQGRRGGWGWVWRPWLAGVLGVVCYLNSLPNGFTYDDKEIVRDNRDIRAVTNLRAIWLSEWWASRGARAALPDSERDRLYRPLTLQSFALNYAADRAEADGRPRAWGFHLVNVLLHGVVCVLAWRLGERLTGDAAMAGVAACLFAAHPVHCEAVANVVGRAELLAGLFLTAGLVVLTRCGGWPGWGRSAGAAGCFLLALFSKESAICYPLLAAVVLLADRERSAATGADAAAATGADATAAGATEAGAASTGPADSGAAGAAARAAGWRRRWMTVCVLLAPLVIYFPMRYVALDGQLLRSGRPNGIFNPLVDADWRGRLIGPLTVAGHYARLTVFPLTLSSDYGRDVIVAERLEPLTVVGVVVVLAAAAGLAGFGRRSAGWRRVAAAAALAVGSYVLISNTVILAGVSVAERLLYFPSLALCLLLALGWGALRRAVIGRRAPAWVAPGAACVVVTLLAARTVARNPDWRSDATLAARDVATYPLNASLQSFMARSLMDEADAAATPRARRRLYQLADRRLERSLRIVFRNPYALHMRGRVRAGLLDYPAAVALLELSIRLYPHDAEAQSFLARVRATYTGDAALEGALRAELERDAEDAVLHQRLGETLFRLGRSDEALAELRRAVELDAEEVDARRMIGEVLASQERDDEALAALRDALGRDPEHWLTHMNLSAVLSAAAPGEALRHAEEAFRLRPDEFAADANLAEALVINGRAAEAVARYRRILALLAPGDGQRAFVEQRIAELGGTK